MRGADADSHMMGNYVDQFWMGPSCTGPGRVHQGDSRCRGSIELITGTGQKVEGLHDAWQGHGWKVRGNCRRLLEHTVRPK